MCSAFNSSYIFAKSFTKSNRFASYLAGFPLFLKECLRGLEEDEINVSCSIDTESLTACFIVH